MESMRAKCRAREKVLDTILTWYRNAVAPIAHAKVSFSPTLEVESTGLEHQVLTGRVTRKSGILPALPVSQASIIDGFHAVNGIIRSEYDGHVCGLLRAPFRRRLKSCWNRRNALGSNYSVSSSH
jgi:hypothetical protein